jgi:ribosomal-protein-alanine N-acetyltransferase
MTRRARKRGAAAAVRLRDYQPSDFERLWEIDQLCYEPLIAYSRRSMRAYLNAPGADCVVAEIGVGANAKIAGFCITTRRGDEAYIVTIDVLPEFRKQRVGSALLAKAENQLAARGVRQVTLDTAVDNVAAISFWQKHGYRKIGLRKDYYPNGVDAFAMTKPIAPYQTTART